MEVCVQRTGSLSWEGICLRGGEKPMDLEHCKPMPSQSRLPVLCYIFISCYPYLLQAKPDTAPHEVQTSLLRFARCVLLHSVRFQVIQFPEFVSFYGSDHPDFEQSCILHLRQLVVQNMWRLEGPLLHQLVIFFGAHFSNFIICIENKLCKVIDDF